MLRRLVLAAACSTICSLPGWAADPPASAQAPWKATFSTQVRGVERAFVEHDGHTYLLATVADLTAPQAGALDVALTAKLRKLPGGKMGLYKADGVVLDAPTELIGGRLDGDNLHLVGRLEAGVLTMHAAIPAPSDSQLIQTRLAGIPDDDWDRRLGAVSWLRDQAVAAGNIDFWQAAAEQQLTRIITDMSAAAGERRDVALMRRGVELAVTQLKDPGVAARVAAAPWLREHGGPAVEALNRRLRSLGYEFYKDAWLPRAEALTREFEDRFAAITWMDADAFYKLGRWADTNAEFLPLARERSWRCYQAGAKGNPNHPGIRRELGQTPPSASATAETPAAADDDHADAATGLCLAAPAGWRKGKPMNGDVTWIDPTSETAFVSARAVPSPVDRDGLWRTLVEAARAREAFTQISEDDAPALRTLRYTWTEAGNVRFATTALITLGDGKPAAVVEARGQTTDQAHLDQALANLASGASMRTAPAQP